MTTRQTRPNGAAVASRTAVAIHPLHGAAPSGLAETGEAATIPSDTPSRAGRERISPRRWWLKLPRAVPRPDTARAHDPDEALRMLHLVRRSRRYAVWLTAGIATVSFVLSFESLRDLAAMSAWPGWSSYLWPLIIDGTIVLATLGIVALAPYRTQLWNRRYFWIVLVLAAAVSVGGNAVHAWLATAHLDSWMRYGSAGLACVPPLALLATTHSMAILWRFNPTPPADATSQVRDGALASATARMAEWEAAATKIHDEGYCRNVPTTKVAHALRYLYDHRPAMSLRAIGATPEVDLHHDNVGKIRDAATAVFGTAPGSGRT